MSPSLRQGTDALVGAFAVLEQTRPLRVLNEALDLEQPPGPLER